MIAYNFLPSCRPDQGTSGGILTTMLGKQYYVYILRNNIGMFYIGMTSNLLQRVWQHKHKFVESYTKKYTIDTLVYYEIHETIESAALREKQLKNWNRKKKILLITKMNPSFEELVIDD